jgi:hypothetical protein
VRRGEAEVWVMRVVVLVVEEEMGERDWVLWSYGKYVSECGEDDRMDK